MVGTGHLVYCDIRACVRRSQRLKMFRKKTSQLRTRGVEREERDKFVRRR